jgi:choline transport protein
MIQGITILNHPYYVAERWHTTLIMICIAGLATLFNIYSKKLLPLWGTLTGIFHVLFFFIILIALNAVGKKADNNQVWANFINAGGWPNDGVSFCLGFITPAFALAGVDGIVHMSEETHNAPKNIPRAMIYSVIINGLAGFAYSITILYCITDVNAIFETPTGFPIIVVFLQGTTNNTRAVTAMMIAIILIFAMAPFGLIASVSRLIWAFARDQGLPFSSFFSHITPWNKCPVNAVLAVFVSVSLLSLINIASSTAFNGLVSLASLGFYFSYAIPILMFTIRRVDSANPINFGPWTMGKIGLIVNTLAIAFCVFLIVILPFPAVLPVTSTNMNYASPLFIAVMLFALVNYSLRTRKRFVGPIKEVNSNARTEGV